MVQPAENTVDLQKLQRKLHYKSTKTCIHRLSPKKLFWIEIIVSLKAIFCCKNARSL